MRVDAENVSNGSTVEALWALGALEPKKMVKAARRAGWVWWKGCRKQPPKAPFSATLSVQRLIRLSLHPPNLAPRPLCSEWCSLDLTCGPIACNMVYGTRSPTSFRPLLYHRLCVASSVCFLSRRKLASNHRRTVDSVPHGRLPFTLARSGDGYTEVTACWRGS